MKILRCREVFMALFFVLGTQSAEAQVDGYPVQFSSLYPTTREQCSTERSRQHADLMGIHAEIRQCNQRLSNASYRSIEVSECNYSAPSICAPLHAQKCSLSKEMHEQFMTCIDRANELERQEAARRRIAEERESAAEAAARELLRQRDSAFTMAQNAFSNGDVRQANAILNRYVDPNDPTRAPLQIYRDGRQVAGMLGLSTSRGMQLQGHFQTIGMNAFREMTGNVVRQLDAAGGSGAFALDQGEGGGDNSTISRATPLASGGYGEGGYTPEQISALSEIWQSGDTMGQILVAAAIIADIAAIYQSEPADRGNTSSRPSLIAGTFAQNIGRLSEAAARGDISLSDGPIDVYQLESQTLTVRVSEARRQAEAERQAELLFEQNLQTNNARDVTYCMKDVTSKNFVSVDIIVLKNTCSFPVFCFIGRNDYTTPWYPNWTAGHLKIDSILCETEQTR